ncbi:MAG: MFS transporter [Acidimicrobiia bacterium]|nr:MFS transporter [Acidimicrobiia bacterium]
MQPGGRILTRHWPLDGQHADELLSARDDLVLEDDPPGAMSLRHEIATGTTSAETGSPDDGLTAGLARTGPLEFTQRDGPFTEYRRTLDVDDEGFVEHTEYRLKIPWFGWLFRLPVKGVLSRRISDDGWWSPPDRLDATQVLVLGLLAAAAMSAAFVNTLFTQTANFAADDFGVGDTGIGIAGAVVRAGIIFALPAAVLADRIGRRRVIVVVAWLAPLLSVLGAFAPTFGVLVATQTIARPMGIALAILVGVVAAEEMPRNSRAYAISVLAMASGFGAGIAVISLRLADLGESGWRLVYLVSAIWCLVALDLTRRLPETRRFRAARDETGAVHPPRLDRGRLLLLSAVAFAGNIFIAPASFFQNRYLTDIHGFSGGMIAVFSIAVGTPAAIGLILGGRIADTTGRKRLIAIALPLSTAAIVGAYSVGGPPLWLFSLAGGMLASAAYPALAVYRAELFPTGNRSRAAGLVTAAALLGGIGGLVTTGGLLDADWSYGSVMATLAIGQIVVTLLVVIAYPETAHRELEDLNPEDEPINIAGL